MRSGSDRSVPQRWPSLPSPVRVVSTRQSCSLQVVDLSPENSSRFEVESATLRGDGRMKRSRFTEEQIIGVLREQEAGMKVAEVCRKHGISEPTFYAWKAKFGGMSISDAKRLRQLEDENAKLKKLLAEAMLDNAVLKDITSRKW